MSANSTIQYNQRHLKFARKKIWQVADQKCKQGKTDFFCFIKNLLKRITIFIIRMLSDLEIQFMKGGYLFSFSKSKQFIRYGTTFILTAPKSRFMWVRYSE